jgi:tetratricopeptide (TPR) repeat protein
MAQQALGDVEGALRSYDTALERDPANVACRSRRFQIHNEAEDWARCQIDVEAMLGLTPDNPSLLLSQGRLCVRNGLRDDALVAYDRLIVLEPENADAYSERSALHVGRGDTMLARADLARAFELAPDDLDIRASHGCDQVQGATTPEERAAGMQLIASSAELDAENPEAWSRAAYSFRRAGAFGEAVRCITRALELDPDNVEYLDERVTCLRCAAPWSGTDPDGHRASLVAALADADRAILLSTTEDVELYRQRATLREETGDLAGSLADQTRIIEMDPSSMDTYMDRARVRKLTGDMPGALADAARVSVMEDEWLAEVATHPELGKIELKRFNLDSE